MGNKCAVVLFLELVFPEVCVPHPSLNPIPGPSQTLHERMAHILLWIRGTNAHKKEGVIGKHTNVLKVLNDLNGDGNFHSYSFMGHDDIHCKKIIS